MRDTYLLGEAADVTGGRVVFRSDCPSRPILDQIADKWSMMIMAVLERPTRFNELMRRLEGSRSGCSPSRCAAWNATG